MADDSVPWDVETDGSYEVTLTEEQLELLYEEFPLPTVTEALRASSMRGVEASQKDADRDVEAKNVQIIEENHGEVTQDNG